MPGLFYAISQRNLTDFVKYELVKDIEAILKKKGKQRQAENLSRNINTESVINDTFDKDTHSTRSELVKKTGLSSGQIAKAKVIDKEAPEELKEELRKGETTIGHFFHGK